MNEIKRAVITGATGMIGLALIEYLQSINIEVTALIRPGSEKRNRLKDFKKLKITEMDLSCLKAEGLPESDAFFHLGWEGTFGASRNDMYLQNRNIRYTLDAVKMAEELGCHVFIGAGSQAEYGRAAAQGEQKLSAETPVFPETGYGMAKLCAGQMSREYCRRLGIRHEWVRILSVYGPYDTEKTMVMSTIRKLLSGERPVFSKGEQRWDYLYAADAARALYCIANKGSDGAVYPLGSGKEKPLYEYIKTIRDMVNKKAELGIGELPYGENQVMFLCAETTSLAGDTGFVPEISFEEGIARTVEWCRNEYIHRNKAHG